VPHKRAPLDTTLTVAPVCNNAGRHTGLRWLIRDVTEQRQAAALLKQHEADLAHVCRVSVMGEMAAGLAHELNQPLAAIMNYARGCVRRLDAHTDPGELRSALEEVTLQAERAGAILGRLRAFVSKRPFQRAPVAINDVVRDVLELAAADLRPAVPKVRLDLADSLPNVYIDRLQIEQVLLNLVRNAIEAMRGCPLRERELVLRTGRGEEGTVLVSVNDNGCGLAASVIERLFDPFFTTKPEGMGMGLAISRSILEAHSQHLWATPSEERGATFQFTLPVCQGELSDET
jgi:C4-dicarboxylate-specific signal transduction histidine kinase